MIPVYKSSLMSISYNAIMPTDPQYDEWNDRGVNELFKGRPDFIIPVSTVGELKEVLQNTVQQNKYVLVRCGGHCLEGFKRRYLPLAAGITAPYDGQRL